MCSRTKIHSPKQTATRMMNRLSFELLTCGAASGFAYFPFFGLSLSLSRINLYIPPSYDWSEPVLRFGFGGSSLVKTSIFFLTSSSESGIIGHQRSRCASHLVFAMSSPQRAHTTDEPSSKAVLITSSEPWSFKMLSFSSISSLAAFATASWAASSSFRAPDALAFARFSAAVYFAYFSKSVMAASLPPELSFAAAMP